MKLSLSTHRSQQSHTGADGDHGGNNAELPSL